MVAFKMNAEGEEAGVMAELTAFENLVGARRF
jgi:hypothetical protein